MIDSQKIQNRLTCLTEQYSESGLPWTSQRRVLIDVLARRLDHPTVDQIYSDMSERLPDISRTTAYRSLETLAGLQLLRRVEHPGSAVRYDVNLTPHHHFLCIRCDGVRDIEMQDIPGSDQLQFNGQGHGESHDISVLVRGVCADCQGSAAQN